MSIPRQPQFSAAVGRTDSHVYVALILPLADENSHPGLRLVVFAVDKNGSLAERPPIVNATIHGGTLDTIYYDSLVGFADSWVQHAFGGWTLQPKAPSGRIVDFQPTDSIFQLADRVTTLGWTKATHGLLGVLADVLPPTESAKVREVIERNEDLVTEPIRPRG